jgi:hypothetical protein
MRSLTSAALSGGPQNHVPTSKTGDSPDTPGDTEVPDATWEAGNVPPPPFIRNTTRNLHFNEQIFIASPGSPDGVTSCVTTEDGYTWGSMSLAINPMWPYSSADYADSDIPLTRINAYYAGNFVTTPPPGVGKVAAYFKAKDMKFCANQDGVARSSESAQALDRYIVADRWGNQYVMHVSGQADDRLSGDSDNDLIHGAGGHDQISGAAGRDELWGDMGDDTLMGGLERDTLVGNEGKDVLIGSCSRTSPTAPSEQQTKSSISSMAVMSSLYQQLMQTRPSMATSAFTTSQDKALPPRLASCASMEGAQSWVTWMVMDRLILPSECSTSNGFRSGTSFSSWRGRPWQAAFRTKPPSQIWCDHVVVLAVDPKGMALAWGSRWT